MVIETASSRAQSSAYPKRIVSSSTSLRRSVPARRPDANTSTLAVGTAFFPQLKECRSFVLCNGLKRESEFLTKRQDFAHANLGNRSVFDRRDSGATHTKLARQLGLGAAGLFACGLDRQAYFGK